MSNPQTKNEKIEDFVVETVKLYQDAFIAAIEHTLMKLTELTVINENQADLIRKGIQMDVMKLYEFIEEQTHVALDDDNRSVS